MNIENILLFFFNFERIAQNDLYTNLYGILQSGYKSKKLYFFLKNNHFPF